MSCARSWISCASSIGTSTTRRNGNGCWPRSRRSAWRTPNRPPTKRRNVRGSKAVAATAGAGVLGSVAPGPVAFLGEWRLWIRSRRGRTGDDHRTADRSPNHRGRHWIGDETVRQVAVHPSQRGRPVLVVDRYRDEAAYDDPAHGSSQLARPTRVAATPWVGAAPYYLAKFGDDGLH